MTEARKVEPYYSDEAIAARQSLDDADFIAAALKEFRSRHWSPELWALTYGERLIRLAAEAMRRGT